MTTKQWRAVPTYDQPLTEKGNTSASYYRWIQDIELGSPPASEIKISPTGSPFTYTAIRAGFVIVNGGSVSQIKFGRTSSYVTGQTSGTFPVSLGDTITVTYSMLPTITFVPQ